SARGPPPAEGKREKEKGKSGSREPGVTFSLDLVPFSFPEGGYSLLALPRGAEGLRRRPVFRCPEATGLGVAVGTGVSSSSQPARGPAPAVAPPGFVCPTGWGRGPQLSRPPRGGYVATGRASSYSPGGRFPSSGPAGRPVPPPEPSAAG